MIFDKNPDPTSQLKILNTQLRRVIELLEWKPESEKFIDHLTEKITEGKVEYIATLIDSNTHGKATSMALFHLLQAIATYKDDYTKRPSKEVEYPDETIGIR